MAFHGRSQDIEMKHKPSAELLALDALGALDPREQFELHAHVAGCSACRAELRALREVVAALAFTAEPIEPPEELRLRVFSNISLLPLRAPHGETDSRSDSQPQSKLARRVAFSASLLRARPRRRK